MSNDDKKVEAVSREIMDVITRNDLTFNEAHILLNELLKKTYNGAFECKFSSEFIDF